MPNLTFTNSNDTYVVNSAGTYVLNFLDGADTFRVTLGGSGSFTTAYLGAGADYALVRSGDGRIFGEDGNDRIYLYANGWVARGGAGNDWLYARGNGLTIYGDDGADHITFLAASQNITAYGGTEDDVFTGNQVISGNFYGGGGSDVFIGFANTVGNVVNLHGEGGDDVYRISGTNPANAIEAAGQGIDRVVIARGLSYTLPDNIERLTVRPLTGSTTGPATLNGNDQSNLIIGYTNDETINGGIGDDRIIAGAGDDTVNGGAGADRLSGNAGTDTLTGNEGNDTLNGGDGDDQMAGGLGNDIYYVDSLSDSVNENAAAGNDLVRVRVDGYTLPGNVERGAIESPAGLTLHGNGLNNVLIGGVGGDSLFGEDGNDVIQGRNGDDSLDGGTGSDRLYGGNGNDTIEGGNGDDKLYGGDGDDFLCGGPGTDEIHGGAGNDTMCSEGSAVITGGIGNDTFLFDAAITGTAHLVDFTPVDDSIAMEVSVFTDLLGLANPDGTLLAGSFVQGTVAADLDDRIIYDATTGNIFYDPDGSGLQSQILFAHVAAGTALTNSDILIVV